MTAVTDADGRGGALPDDDLAACSTATLAAMVLPWLFDRLGADPAFGSGPLATFVQDLLSLIIYYTVASVVVG
jgi:magnesium transporter